MPDFIIRMSMATEQHCNTILYAAMTRADVFHLYGESPCLNRKGVLSGCSHEDDRAVPIEKNPFFFRDHNLHLPGREVP